MQSHIFAPFDIRCFASFAPGKLISLFSVGSHVLPPGNFWTFLTHPSVLIYCYLSFAGKMAEHLFKDKFKVIRLDPDGKKFDKGNLSDFSTAKLNPLLQQITGCVFLF